MFADRDGSLSPATAMYRISFTVLSSQLWSWPPSPPTVLHPVVNLIARGAGSGLHHGDLRQCRGAGGAENCRTNVDRNASDKLTIDEQGQTRLPRPKGRNAAIVTSGVESPENPHCGYKRRRSQRRDWEGCRASRLRSASRASLGSELAAVAVQGRVRSDQGRRPPLTWVSAGCMSSRCAARSRCSRICSRSLPRKSQRSGHSTRCAATANERRHLYRFPRCLHQRCRILPFQTSCV